ncbi:hypothetical protein F5B20DRAFT_512809 [Whalleya microplaca]|nr:hypothetical protein F5B20DRAFT_512809 [Whalleya microplaca]
MSLSLSTTCDILRFAIATVTVTVTATATAPSRYPSANKLRTLLGGTQDRLQPHSITSASTNDISSCVELWIHWRQLNYPSPRVAKRAVRLLAAAVGDYRFSNTLNRFLGYGQPARPPRQRET